MNVDKLKKVFREAKKEFGFDFAYTNVDRFGDCNSCVCYSLGKKFGDNPTGIYLKYWRHGMNKGRRDLDDPMMTSVYVNHSIDSEKGQSLVNFFRKYYKVEEDFNSEKSIKIEEVV